MAHRFKNADRNTALLLPPDLCNLVAQDDLVHFFSQAIERATYLDAAARYLCANPRPDHDTICASRRNNLEAMASAFVEVLELARELKLLKLGTVSLDGTHIRASASGDKNMTWQRAQQLRLQLRRDVEALLRQAGAADHQSDALRSDSRGDGRHTADSRRSGAVSVKNLHGRAGVWGNQGIAGISAISAARAGESAPEMGAGVSVLQSAFFRLHNG